MPTIYGSSGTDWGLLTALQGKDNWQQKRTDRETDMRYAIGNQKLAEQQLQDQLKAGQDITNIYNEAQKLKVLDPDIIKIREKDQELRKDIYEGIKKFGGNVSQYLKSGGYENLQKYKNDLFNSKELTSGLRRMKDYGAIQKDYEAGKILRPITEDVNGSTMRYDPMKRADDFLTGKATDFSYRGGYDPVSMDLRESFSTLYGSGSKIKPQTATRQDVFNAAKWEIKKTNPNANLEDLEDQANIIADEYQQGVDSKAITPYYYKWDDPMDAKVKQAQINNLNEPNNRGGIDDSQDNAFWIQNVNAGGRNREHALGYIVGASNVNGTVLDIKPQTPYSGIMKGANIGENTMLRNKIVVTYKDPTIPTKTIQKVYDLENTADRSELQSLKQAQKLVGKTPYYNEFISDESSFNPQNGTTTNTQTIRVVLDNGQQGEIPAESFDAFMKENPTAKKL